MNDSVRNRKIVTIAVLLLLCVFIVDASTPLGAEVWPLYLVATFLVARFSKSSDCYVVAALATGCIVASLAVSPPIGITLAYAVVGQVIGITVLWFATYFLVQYSRSLDLLRTHGQELEEQVTERTIALDQAGNFVGLTGTTRDITERKRLEAALRASEERLRAIFELLPVGVSIVDSKHHITENNPALAEILDLTPADLMTGQFERRRYYRADGSLLPPEEFPSLRAIKEQQVIRNVEIGVEKEDGTIIWTSVSATPMSASGYSATVTVDISERKRMEDRLRQSERKYRLLADNVTDVIWTRDLEGKLTYISPSVQRLRGYTVEEALAQSFAETVHPDHLAATMARLSHAVDAIDNGRPLPPDRYQLDQICKDGSTVCLDVISAPLYDESGGFSAFVSVGRDVTERNYLEARLRQSEAKFATAFKANPVGVAIVRQADSRYLDVNDAYLEITGYNYDELIGRTSVELGLVEAAYRAQGIDDIQHKHSDRNRDIIMTTKTGKPVNVIMALEAIEIDGEPCTLDMILDISERKRLEAELRDSEERTRLVLQNSPDIIALYDETGQLTYVSYAIERMLGFEPGQLLASASDLARRVAMQSAETSSGWLLQPSIAADDLGWPQTTAAVRYCLDHPQEQRRIEFRHQTAQGDYRSFESVYQAYARGNTGHEVVSVTHDVTEYKALEEKLRMANEELEQRVTDRTVDLRNAIEKLVRANAGKDAFMAAVSHELRTPLTGILSMAETLESQMRGPLNERQMHYVQTIQHCGDRLLDMINGVLNYTVAMSIAAPPEPEPCRLAELCAISTHALNSKAEHKQQIIEVDVDPIDLEIYSNADGIIRILIALLDNAVKFTPNQGRIGVNINKVTDRDAVQFVVWDTGIGIAEEHLAYLFEPFTQVDQRLARQYEGIGLGLTYVKRMVDLLGGTLTVKTVVGEGSRFTFTLLTGQVQN